MSEIPLVPFHGQRWPYAAASAAAEEWGWIFVCPGCGRVFTLPMDPLPPAWPPGARGWKCLNGDPADMEHLSLSPSILCLSADCGWHGHVLDGKACPV